MTSVVDVVMQVNGCEWAMFRNATGDREQAWSLGFTTGTFPALDG
jgi:hypothetical protein